MIFRMLMLASALLISVGCSSGPSVSDQAKIGGKSALAGISKLDDLSGQSQSLAVNKPLVFVFWQAWCVPCRRKGPLLEKLANAHPQYQFYGVVSGSDSDVQEDKVRALTQKWGLTYPQLRDRDSALSDALGVKGTPTIIVLDTEGEIVYNAHQLPLTWKFESR